MWHMLVRVCLFFSCFSNVMLAMTQQQWPKHKPMRCGGRLTSDRGVIQTPGFPGPFPVPIKCQWIIETADRVPPNNSIVIYLTQLYVTTGLTFTEFAYYEKGKSAIGKQLVHTVTEQNVTLVRWLWTRSPYLVIDFTLDRLEGNHLRVMDQLLDVFGFNITYEISGRENPVRPNSCNVILCSFLGNCFANKDFTRFGCSCFEGFSGPNCGKGPGCEPGRQICQNGASCWHLGSDAIRCNCTPGFTGRRCEVPLPDPHDTAECGEAGCVFQCPFQSGRDEVCKCPRGPRVPTDRARYEGALRLANLTALWDNVAGTGPPRTLQNLLERQIGKYLRSSNLSKLDDLKVLNVTPGAEVKFHFFGGKRDGTKIREALNNLMKRGRLGNLTLVPTYLAFKQEPTLLLQSVKVNHERLIVREGDEFILSCVAQGSPYMTFSWYKDGAFVNKNKTLRNMWTKLLPMDSDDQYTALLGIERASRLDEGVYTCQVVDWDMQQCKALRLEVLVRPEVEVIPKSITVDRGENVSIKCMSPNDQRHEKFGYNWTKNKVLLRMVPGVEVWEDLHPAGSILKIYNAQKSAVYSCMVHGRVANEVKSVYVEVVNRSTVPMCHEERKFGIQWPETAPNLDALQDCPVHYLGTVKRRCNLRNTYFTQWDLPDFSACVSEAVESIRNNFHTLVLGYQNTSSNATLKACHEYLVQHALLYPGEGEAVLDLLQQVLLFMTRAGESEQLLATAQTFYQIINILLERNFSVINTEKVILLQELVKTEALLWGSLLTANTNYAHVDLSSLSLHIAQLENALYKLHLNTSSWFSNQLDVNIEGPSSGAFGNGTCSIAVIAYRNLTEFLPLRYVAKQRYRSSLRRDSETTSLITTPVLQTVPFFINSVITLRDGNEMEFEINSRVVTVELGKDGRRFVPSQGIFHVDIEFEHIEKNYNRDEWNVSCGMTYVAASEHSWDFDACTALTVGTNVTRCRCNQPGTYAALLTTRPTQLPLSVSDRYHTVVLAGCVCCLVQTVFTLLLLLPYWWHHRTCLIFLKLQCCTATSGAMGVFIYAVRDSVPKASFPYVTTSLEAFLLIGMSSHLSKLLIVYTEVIQMPRVQHMKQTVVSIITGVPVLAVLCNHLAHHSTGWQLTSWWLLCGTMLFNIFVASAAVMFILFVFLYFTVMRRLKMLSSKDSVGNKVIGRRIGLLKRAGIIFFVMMMMEASSIFYINVPDSTCHYVFSITSALLGFITFLCYVLRSETPLRIQVLRKMKLENTPEDEYSSESANSPLRFFTKQDGDAESEGAPPRPSSSLNMPGRAMGQGDGDPAEGLLLVETSTRRASPSEGATSTIETFVQSVNSSVEDYGVGGSGPRVVFQEAESRVPLKRDSNNVDLESYHNSPRKYRKQSQSCKEAIDVFSEYVEQDVRVPGVDEQSLSGSGDQRRFVRGFYHNGGTPPVGAVNIPRPEPSQCYIREQTPPPATSMQQEIVTTRVCVELGVITAPRQHLDQQGTGDCGGAPAIVLCSVDVEPCHRGVLDIAEVTAAVEANTCCTNRGIVVETREEHETVTSAEQLRSCNGDGEPDGQEVSPQATSVEEEPQTSFNTAERRQPEGREKPQAAISVTSVTEAAEDMLDRISHDLDYLLNRKPPQNNGGVFGVPAFSRKTSKPPATSVSSQIQEEDENEAVGVISEETVTIGNGSSKS